VRLSLSHFFLTFWVLSGCAVAGLKRNAKGRRACPQISSPSPSARRSFSGLNSPRHSLAHRRGELVEPAWKSGERRLFTCIKLSPTTTRRHPRNDLQVNPWSLVRLPQAIPPTAILGKTVCKPLEARRLNPSLQSGAQNLCVSSIRAVILVTFDRGSSSPVARQAHNLKVAGSNPAPATNSCAVSSVIPMGSVRADELELKPMEPHQNP
jgi:hypothetical protein